MSVLGKKILWDNMSASQKWQIVSKLFIPTALMYKSLHEIEPKYRQRIYDYIEGLEQNKFYAEAAIELDKQIERFEKFKKDTERSSLFMECFYFFSIGILAGILLLRLVQYLSNGI
jgi:hypothetical protein